MNSSTKISITIALCTVVAVALLLPEERSRSIASGFKLLLRDNAELCKEHHKVDFVNPDSVYVVSSTEDVRSESYTYVRVKVSAATRGGGRNTRDLLCVFSFPSGKLDPLLTSARIKNEEFNRSIQDEREQIMQRLSDRRQQQEDGRKPKD